LCFGQSSVHYSIPLACTSCRTPNQDWSKNISTSGASFLGRNDLRRDTWWR
jgi:hypothetical protein